MRTMLMTGLSLAAMVCHSPEGVGSSDGISITGGEAIVDKIALELGNDEAINAFLERYMEAGETVKMSALHVLHMIDDKHPDLLEQFPRLGTKDGNNPEMIKVNRDDGKGGSREQTKSFYSLLADKHPTAIKIKAIMASLNERKKAGSLSPARYATDYGKQDARLRAFRKVFRKAGATYHQLTDMAALPLVIAKHAAIETVGQDGKTVEEFVYSETPMRLQSEKMRDDVVSLSVDNFNRINVAKAIEQAGGADKVTKAHLLATITRASGTAKTTAPKLTKDTFEGVVSGVWNYLDDAGNLGVITAVINKGDKAGNETLLALDALYTKLDGILSPLMGKIATLRDAQEAKKQAA